MKTTSLTLRETRTYAALAVATSLTSSAAIGAGTSAAAGRVAGVLVGGVAALVTTCGTLGALRLAVTSPTRSPASGAGRSRTRLG